MANKKKPTIKELSKEINYIGNKMVDTHMMSRNIGNVFDLYLLFKGETQDFMKFVTDKLKEKAEEKKETSKKEPAKI